MANTPTGISATVLLLIPVILSVSQSRTVMMKVIITMVVFFPFFISPSISRSTVFCENGKIVLSSPQLMNSRTATSGTMISIHSPKPSPRFSPSGSFRYFKAILFGGVPMGVPIPPRFAATGMDSARAIRPFPSGGSCLNTGVRKASIIAAVAVLLTNIENRPVTRMKPRSTFSLFLPKGFSNAFAR